MEKGNSKKVAIASTVVISLLLVGMITLFCMPYGNQADFRFLNSGINYLDKIAENDELSSLESYSFNEEGRENSENLSISGNGMLENCSTNVTYIRGEQVNSFSNLIGLSSGLLDKNYSYLVVVREGSYFKESEVRHVKIKDNSVSMTYVIEDDQILKPTYENALDCYCYDFFKTPDSFNFTDVSINITDKLC